MICSMIAPGECRVSKKTAGNLAAARRSRSIGVVTITAPRVPPRTMMAAVSCATSVTLPFSSTSPPRMPVSARAKPPMVARSRRRPDSFFAESRAGAVVFAMAYSTSIAVHGIVRRPAQSVHAGGRIERNTPVDSPAEFHYPPDYLFGRFQHHQLLSAGQTDHRVGSDLDQFDEVGIEHQRQMVEAREMNHDPSILIGHVRGTRPGFQQKAALPAGRDDPAAKPQFAVEQTVHRAVDGKIECQHVA